MSTTSTATPQMSDEANRNGSGKTWAEWVGIRDAWGAAEKSHAEIARHVSALGVDGWWAQGVAVGYERIRGLREQGQRRDGRFEGSASKTFPFPVARLSAAWTDETERDEWLAPGTLTLRTAQDGRSARFDIVNGGGVLALWFTDKGPDKSSVQLQHDKLPSKEAAVEFRDTWKARLADLANHLKG